jgi:RNA polymerase sigma-70 factor (ECF subfamily)
MKAQEDDAWMCFADLYAPRVYRWCRQEGLSPDNAADVVQDVFVSVVTGIKEFRGEQPCGSFRAWLRSITRHRVADFFRRRQGTLQAPGGTESQWGLRQVPEAVHPPEPEGPSQEDDVVWRRALAMVGAEFEDSTWQAFWRTTIQGESPADVAREMGTTVHAVYKAKSRVLRRVRNRLNELEGEY